MIFTKISNDCEEENVLKNYLTNFDKKGRYSMIVIKEIQLLYLEEANIMISFLKTHFPAKLMLMYLMQLKLTIQLYR